MRGIMSHITEIAKTSRPILTVKTAGPAWAHQTFLKLNYPTDVLCKKIYNTDPCFEKKKQQNEYPGQTRVIDKHFQLSMIFVNLF